MILSGWLAGFSLFVINFSLDNSYRHISVELVVGFHLKTFVSNWMRFVCQQLTFIYNQIPILILHRNVFSALRALCTKIKIIILGSPITSTSTNFFSPSNVCGANVFGIWFIFKADTSTEWWIPVFLSKLWLVFTDFT